MLAPEEAAKRLIALADRMRVLTVRRDKPHAFFEDREEINADMRRLAVEISGRDIRLIERAARGSFKPGAIAHKGRIVPVQTRGVARRSPARTLAEKVFA